MTGDEASRAAPARPPGGGRAAGGSVRSPDDLVWTEPEEIVEKVATEVLPGLRA